jgi:hypothetical protein
MKKTTNKDLVIEDVIWFEKNEGGNKDRCPYRSSAKSTFYYTFLMDNSDCSIQGQNNLKAANDFLAFEDIYVFLLNLGILNNKHYCLDWSEIYGGATFSFNLGKALEDIDLENVLTEHFTDKEMSDYIKTFCHPADSFRCKFCGAVSLSRHLCFTDDHGDREVHCFACHPIDDELSLLKIKATYEELGSIEAVQLRNELIETATIAKIAPNKTINMLLDEFIASNKTDLGNAARKVEVIQKIFDEGDYDEWEAFAYDKYGIVMLNRARLADIKIFSDSVSLSEEGDEILTMFNNVGVVYLDDAAIEFAKRMTENKEYIKILEEVL